MPENPFYKPELPGGIFEGRVLKKGESGILVQCFAYNDEAEPGKFFIVTKKGETDPIEVDQHYNFKLSVKAELDRKTEKPRLVFFLRDYHQIY